MQVALGRVKIDKGKSYIEAYTTASFGLVLAAGETAEFKVTAVMVTKGGRENHLDASSNVTFYGPAAVTDISPSSVALGTTGEVSDKHDLYLDHFDTNTINDKTQNLHLLYNHNVHIVNRM